MNRNRQNNKNPYINEPFKYLPYLGGILYFIACLLVYTYSISYCQYYNIPLEYVSFTLSNNIITSLFYYSALTIFFAMCFFVVSSISSILINKCLSFICSYLIIILITITLMVFYFYIMLDKTVYEIIYYLITDSFGHKTLCVFLLIAFLITISCVILIKMSPFRVNEIKQVNNSDKSLIFTELKKQFCSNKQLYIISRYNILSLFLAIIFVSFILWYVAFIGHDNAKKCKKFWIVYDYHNKTETYVKLYSENDKIILAPYIIASNSIIINNSLITVKNNVDVTLISVEKDSFNLLISPDGDIDEDLDKLFDANE